MLAAPIQQQDDIGRAWANMSFRPFGDELQHLDIEFDRQDQATVVTTLLMSCLADTTEEEIWHWTLQKRLQALLRLSLMSEVKRTDLQTACVHCDAKAVLPIQFNDFLQAVAVDRFIERIEETEYEIRLPTGRDQLAVQQVCLENQSEKGGEDQAFLKWVRDLVSGVKQDPTWSPNFEVALTIERAIAKKDPLTNLLLNTHCPECSQAYKVALDLEAVLLEKLAQIQLQRLKQIHQLAFYYHWTERDIFSLSPTRRAYYLKQIRAATQEWA